MKRMLCCVLLMMLCMVCPSIVQGEEPMETGVPITLTSPSAILTEASTGRVIFEKNADGVTWNWLIPNAQKNMMEPVLIELDEGAATAGDIPHEGEEFGYVLEGKIAVVLGKKQYPCKKGEAFYYPASKPHSIVNKGKSKAKFLWVSTPPNF